MQIYEILAIYANLPFIFNPQTTALSFRISIRYPTRAGAGTAHYYLAQHLGTEP